MWKAKAEILSPDERYGLIVRIDDLRQGIRPITIEDMYEDVARFDLPPNVPAAIARQFNVARSAYLYSWFDYEMVTLAEEHIYTVVEMALRQKAANEKSPMRKGAGMRAALNHARAQGWIRDEEFGQALDMLPELRNRLMHGQHHLFPAGSLRVMDVAYRVIVALFP